MQIKNMHPMNAAKDRFFKSARASRPRISPTDTFAPSFFGGVCGSVKANSPNAIDNPPAR